MVKAARLSRFGGPEVLEIVDLPDPHPGPGQVRIAVRAAGVNPSDWKKRTGLIDPELPGRQRQDQHRVRPVGPAGVALVGRERRLPADPGCATGAAGRVRSVLAGPW